MIWNRGEDQRRWRWERVERWEVRQYKKGWFVKYEWMVVFRNQGDGIVGKNPTC